MEIFYSSRFKRLFKKLPRGLAKIIDERINIFIENPFDSRLKTHRLSGKLKGYWSFSITHKHRIIFEFISSSTIRFIDIGDHNIYR